MTTPDLLSLGSATLDKCDKALAELDELCCEPDRSPRMAALADSLSLIRSDLERLEMEPEAADSLLEQLEDAGSQIGRLQITCCAPSRMPLYSELLAGLSRTQRIVTKATDKGH